VRGRASQLKSITSAISYSSAKQRKSAIVR
jgi:hypothetical protein